MSFTSYAQNFEDVMLWRAVGHVPAGTYVDVGAQHPEIDSVSKAFYERGWRGTHIEPVAEFADLLRRDRPDETVLQVALGAAEGTLALNVIANTGLSTAVDAHAQRHHDEQGMQAWRIEVPVLTLKSALQSLAGKEVHWLKIDVEGYEEQVLRGWDSAVLRPWVMVVEATVPGSPTIDCAAWDPILVAADYRFVYFDGLNRFYIAAEHAELAPAFSCPPNVFDDVELSGRASSALCRGVAEKYRAELAALSADMGILVPQLLQANARLAAKQEDAGWLHEEAEMARRQLDAMAAEAGGARARCQLLEAHIKMREGEWKLATSKVAELQASTHQLRSLTDNLNQALQDMRASTSWRITAPWRYAGSVYRRLRAALRSGTLGAGVRRRAWRAARGVGQAVLRNRAAKRAARRLLGRFPRLQARLREMMVQSPLTPGAPAPSSPQAGDLSPRAQRLYAELKQATSKKEH
jgi:FkbM family methyltransferase